MAKVEAKLGFTLKINKKDSYEFIRPEIGISDIDTNVDIYPQLELAEKALKETLDKISNIAGDEILINFDMDKELVSQLQRKFKKLDIEIEELKSQIIKKVEKEV